MSEKISVQDEIKKDVEAIKNDDSLKSAEEVSLAIAAVRKKQANANKSAAPIPGVDMTEIRPNSETKLVSPALDPEIAAAQAELDEINQKLASRLKPAKQDQELATERQKELELARAKELEEAKDEELEEARARDVQDIMYEEARDKEFEEARARDVQAIMYEEATPEEKAAWQAELDEINQKLQNPHRKMDELNEAHPDRLVAITADWTHDKHEMARDLAEQALNAETAKDGLIQRIWKGSVFKKYYEQKYAKEYLSGERTDNKGRNLYEIIRDQHDDVVERFVKGATEDMRYIHEKIGKKDKNGDYDGEKIVEADEKTNEQIKYAIEQYARYKLKLGDRESDIDAQFENQMDRVIQEAIDDGRLNDGAKTNNYLEVAKKAAERYKEVAKNAKNAAEHEAAMAEVMAGFQVYNAEVRNNVRTEAHRDNIDKIVNKIESSKLGRFIPAELVTGAAGIAAGLTQTGIRAVFGAAGGIVASSAIQALRERNRLAEDRSRMLRDVANGLDYSETGKIGKYETRIGGTLYDLQKATDLTKRINDALNPENAASPMELFSALAEARVRIDYSDSHQKDLIAYSSPDNRGKERLALDTAVIRLEKTLTEEEKTKVDALKRKITRDIVEGYEDESGEHHAGLREKDAEFKHLRTVATVKRAGKTLALGAGIFLGSQEVIAAIDPQKIGIFEKAGLLKTANEEGAKETILASGFGLFRGKYEIPGVPSSRHIYNVSDPDVIARSEANGYTKQLVSEGGTRIKETLTEVDPSASTARVNVKYDAWASGSTKNLRFRLENGTFTSNISGNATTGAGEAINYNPDNLKAFITVGDSKFEIAGSLNEAGQMSWGENGVFTTTTGETIRGIGENGEKLYRYFEIAVDNNSGNTDGLQHIIPLATDTGANTFSGKITQVVSEATEIPAVYNLVKEIPGESTTVIREVSGQGIGFAPILGRTGLGEARRLSPESERWNADILREIANNAELLGGEEGVSIITGRDELNQATSERYHTWWDGLSENGKNFVNYLMGRIDDFDDRYKLDWGNGFHTWLVANA